MNHQFTRSLDQFNNEFLSIISGDGEASASDTTRRTFRYRGSIFDLMRHKLGAKITFDKVPRIGLIEPKLVDMSPKKIRLVGDDKEFVELVIEAEFDSVAEANLGMRTLSEILIGHIVVFAREPLSISAYAIEDLKHGSIFRSSTAELRDLLPVRKIVFDDSIMLREDHVLAFGLLKESINSNSPYYSLLASYKLLESWGTLFNATTIGLKALDRSLKRQTIRVTREMVELAGASEIQEALAWIGKDTTQFCSAIRTYRDRIAHAFLGQRTRKGAQDSDIIIVPLNAQDSVQRIGFVHAARVTQDMAIQVLKEELRVFQAITELNGEE